MFAATLTRWKRECARVTAECERVHCDRDRLRLDAQDLVRLLGEHLNTLEAAASPDAVRGAMEAMRSLIAAHRAFA